MEYVDGLPITTYCDRTGSTSRAAAAVPEVCAAVQHAHQNLVIHRDLKPTQHPGLDATARVKLLDFGIAKLINPALDRRPCAADAHRLAR